MQRASTHPSEHVPSRLAFDRSHERHHLGALSGFDERENHTRLEKRGAMTIAYRSNAENADLNHAYQDMVSHRLAGGKIQGFRPNIKKSRLATHHNSITRTPIEKFIVSHLFFLSRS